MAVSLNTYSNNHLVSGWHYSRSQIAENYLKTLSSGVMLSTTVYAPPKTGLTNFFINDVIPQAQENKYATIYIDLSEPTIPVTASVLVALERELMGTSIFRSGFNVVKGFFQVKDAYLDNKQNYANKQPIDIKYFEENIDEHLYIINNHFERICKNKSVLVIIDHVNNIVRDKIGSEFVRYFSAVVENKRGCLKPLYGTSNMERWRTVFDNPASLLHSEGAFVHKLPNLGKLFVREALLRSGQSIKMDEALASYEISECRPGIFISLLMSWKPQGGLSFYNYCSESLCESNLLKNKIEYQIN